jgi:hypothetical protein
MKQNGGYVQPADMYEPFPPPRSPPTPPLPTPAPAPTPPVPIPAGCLKALKAKCPLPFKSYGDCLTCTRKYANKPTCSPGERYTYCGGGLGAAI